MFYEIKIFSFLMFSFYFKCLVGYVPKRNCGWFFMKLVVNSQTGILLSLVHHLLILQFINRLKSICSIL